jgi:hypothetical protein
MGLHRHSGPDEIVIEEKTMEARTCGGKSPNEQVEKKRLRELLMNLQKS